VKESLDRAGERRLFSNLTPQCLKIIFPGFDMTLGKAPSTMLFLDQQHLNRTVSIAPIDHAAGGVARR